MSEKLQALTKTFNLLDSCHRYLHVQYDLYQSSWEGDPFWVGVGDFGLDQNCYESDHEQRAALEEEDRYHYGYYTNSGLLAECWEYNQTFPTQKLSYPDWLWFYYILAEDEFTEDDDYLHEIVFQQLVVYERLEDEDSFRVGQLMSDLYYCDNNWLDETREQMAADLSELGWEWTGKTYNHP